MKHFLFLVHHAYMFQKDQFLCMDPCNLELNHFIKCTILTFKFICVIQTLNFNNYLAEYNN